MPTAERPSMQSRSMRGTSSVTCAIGPPLVRRGAYAEDARQPRGQPLPGVAGVGRGVHVTARGAEVDARLLAAVQRHRDRKSTRLNSSHLVISYAVFCLKKKKYRPHHAAL